MERTCARCGRELTIEEFIGNNIECVILGHHCMLHFCHSCACLIIDGRE